MFYEGFERCRIKMLAMYNRANAGHIGSSLSCLEIIYFLFAEIIRGDDLFILSKGHAAGALYAVLDEFGRLGPACLDDFYQNDSFLAAHPPCSRVIPSIPFGTGSLGHGLSLACGLALGAKIKGTKAKIYCLVSDGDINEGSSWEAVMFAVQHKLDNLTLIVDANGLQGFGKTCDVMNLEPLSEKFRAFGCDVTEIANGNDIKELSVAICESKAVKANALPRCIIARTIKGHSVSFMENRLEWHYLPMNESQYIEAISSDGGVNA